MPNGNPAVPMLSCYSYNRYTLYILLIHISAGCSTLVPIPND